MSNILMAYKFCLEKLNPKKLTFATGQIVHNFVITQLFIIFFFFYNLISFFANNNY